MSETWLDVPCPSCGEYSLEAVVLLRDVTLRVAPEEAGALRVVVTNADAHLAAAVCHTCGEEPDPDGDDQLGDAFENAAEAWLARLSDDHD